MNNEWNVCGWDHLAIHNDPPLPNARNEFLDWVEELPQPHRSDIDRRLKSHLDHPHLSARLELFVHHYFASSGWVLECHPPRVDSTNRPDFLATRHDGSTLIECKTLMDQRDISQQDQRLRQLADDLNTRLKTTTILHPLKDLPPSLPVNYIRNEIESRLPEVIDTETIEFDIVGTHQGLDYGLRVVVLQPTFECESANGVQGTVSQASNCTNMIRLRKELREKAGKYGELEAPFIIAVSSGTFFPLSTKEEIDALFGTRVLHINGADNATKSRSLDGLFTVHRNGSPRYARVSAVLVYRFKWSETSHSHNLHLYHNPYAARPIDSATFPGVPQFIKSEANTMRWEGSEPNSC